MLYETDGEVHSDTPLPPAFSCALPAFMSAITYFPDKEHRKGGACAEEDTEQGVTFYISAEADGPRRRSDCECPDFRNETDPLAHGILRNGLSHLNTAVQNGELQSLGLLLSMNPGDSLRWKVSDAHKVEKYRYPPCGSIGVCGEKPTLTVSQQTTARIGKWPDAPYSLSM